MRFTKMQAAGNDYIYLNATESIPDSPEWLARKWSRRRFGIGADGLVLILPSEIADVRMRIFNSDGSEGRMCGNAARCVAKYVYERGLISSDTLTLETESGIRRVWLTVENGRVESVRVGMGVPDFRATAMPAVGFGEGEIVRREIRAGGVSFRITCVSYGNPHGVIFFEDAFPDLSLFGAAIGNLACFPNGINVEFARVVGVNRLEMRVFERGSGITLSCGSGACACAAAAVRCGFCRFSEPITVCTRGGDLRVEFAADGSTDLIGPAEFVFEGEVE